MRRYFDEIEAVVTRHGGTVEKFVGDAAMAVFGIPQVHEDDALRAVRAAAEIRERLPAVAAELGVELSFRTGVNTGEVVVGAGQTSPPATPSTSPRASSRPLTRGDPHRRRDVPARPLRGRGRAGRAARAEGEGRPRGCVPTRDRRPGGGGGRPPPRRAAHRAGARARPPARAYERAVEERSCDLFTLLGACGCRQVAPRGRIPRRGRAGRDGGDRALPPLRRRDHVLAPGRDADATRRRRGADARARHRGWDRVARGPVLGGSPAARGGGGRAAARRRVRGPALGRADAARPARPRRRPLPRLTALAALHRPPRAPRRSPRLGGGKLRATTVLLEPLPGGGLRAPARHPRRRARPRNAKRSSTPRKGTRSSSRRWPCWPARAATCPSRPRSRRCSPRGWSSCRARSGP